MERGHQVPPLGGQERRDPPPVRMDLPKLDDDVELLRWQIGAGLELRRPAVMKGEKGCFTWAVGA